MKCRQAWALLALCVAPAIVSAEILPDPTKPPAEVSAPQGAFVPAGNALQTIIISPHRRAAIIDGQTVELGAKHGDVRLIEVSEGGVVLEGSEGRKTLALFPSVKISKENTLPPAKHRVKPAARQKATAGAATSSAGKKEEK